MNEATTIQLDKKIHKRFRIISAYTDKRLFELLEESVRLLEEKYRIPINTIEVNNE